MKVKPIEMGLEVSGNQHEVPSMLERLAEYAGDFGYLVDKVKFSKDWEDDVVITMEFDEHKETYR